MQYSAAPPVATSLAGEAILYVVCPLLVAGIIGIVTFMNRLAHRVSQVEDDQRAVMRELNPDGKPSMRDMLGDVRAKQGELTSAGALVAEQLRATRELMDDRYHRDRQERPAGWPVG